MPMKRILQMSQKELRDTFARAGLIQIRMAALKELDPLDDKSLMVMKSFILDESESPGLRLETIFKIVEKITDVELVRNILLGFYEIIDPLISQKVREMLELTYGPDSFPEEDDPDGVESSLYENLMYQREYKRPDTRADLSLGQKIVTTYFEPKDA